MDFSNFFDTTRHALTLVDTSNITQVLSSMLKGVGNASPAETLIALKHREYARKATLFKWLYYFTRLVTGLAAGVLPFFIRDDPKWATGLSVTIVIITVFDTVLSPKDKWALYSKACDYLTVGRLKVSGEYEKYKELIDILFQTESKALAQLVSLNEVIEEAQKAKKENQSFEK